MCRPIYRLVHTSQVPAGRISKRFVPTMFCTKQQKIGFAMPAQFQPQRLALQVLHSHGLRAPWACSRFLQPLIQRQRRRPAQQAPGFFNIHLQGTAQALRHIGLAQHRRRQFQLAGRHWNQTRRAAHGLAHATQQFRGGNIFIFGHQPSPKRSLFDSCLRLPYMGYRPVSHRKFESTPVTS